MSLAGAAQDTFGRAAKIGGPVVIAGGAFSDVVTPLAPVALYATILAGSITVLSGCIWFFGYRRKFVTAMRDGKIDATEARELAATNRWAILFAFSFIAMIIMGIVTATGATISKDNRGALASSIPALQKIQNDLFDLKKDVKDIKKDTEKIASDTGEIKKTLADIAKGFENLKGGAIANPKSPQEHYHNARFHELGANFPAADKSYRTYFDFRLEFVDPHLRYATMLKMWQGKEEAQEKYDYFVQVYKIPAVRLARALLNSKGKRLAPMEALVKEEPGFAPGWYQVALAYSPKKRPNQTLSDKKSEKAALGKLRELDGEGKFVRWFLDKSVPAEWREEAEGRWTALEIFGKAPPVKLITMQSNQGWTLTFQIMERGIEEIFYRMDGKGEFTSTGSNPGIVDSLTGKPLANQYVSLENLEPGNHKVEVKYRNMRGEDQGPFPMEFSTHAEIIKNTKHILNLTPGWLSFRPWDENLMVYFSHLLSYRNAIREIRYSIDSEKLDRKFPFTPWTKAGTPRSERGSKSYLLVSYATKYLAVQLLYLDDTESEVKKFQNRISSTLETLEISPCNDVKLRQVEILTNIRDLDLSGTKVTDSGLPSLKGMTKLEKLNLSGTRITDAGLVHLGGFANLAELHLPSQITDAGLPHLRGLVNIRVLDLKEAKITDKGLPALLGMTRLATLNLKDTGVSDEGIQTLLELAEFETLNLENTGLTDVGLAQLPRLEKLEKLDLGKTPVTDAGMESLGKCTGLKELSLWDVKITDAGLAHLHGLKKLEKLQLNYTKVTDEGVTALQEALPNCKITR